MARAWILLLPLAAACGPPLPDGPVATHVEDWRDHVVYQIVVDRFDDGEPTNNTLDGVGVVPDDLARHQGGDWAGIRRRLDYLERLGVSALWLSPPYRNVSTGDLEDGYHGYWPADFTEANPRFGDLDELRLLVREAHARGMLVILDVVPNHAGRVFAYDLDGDGEVDPSELEPPFSEDGPYDAPLLFSHTPRMWRDGVPTRLGPEDFHRRGFGDLSDPRQKELGDFPTGLRDLDTENPATVEALIETHVRWVLDTDVDGFRVDAVPHAPAAFWERFCTGLRERLAAEGKERFLLLGEVFTASAAELARYSDVGQLDAAFAFDLKVELIDGVILAGGPPVDAVGALGGHRALFPASPQPMGVGLDPWQARVAFADNHDVWRVRGELDDPFAVQVALTVVFTVDAIPSVYYGTEQDLDGRSHHEAREPLWLESDFGEDGATFRHIARLAAIRASSPALRYGTLTVRYAAESGGFEPDGPDAGMLAYEREHEGDRVVVVLNAALEESTATFPTGFAPGALVDDALGAADAPWEAGPGGVLTVRLPGRAAVVLRPR